MDNEFLRYSKKVLLIGTADRDGRFPRYPVPKKKKVVDEAIRIASELFYKSKKLSKSSLVLQAPDLDKRPSLEKFDKIWTRLIERFSSLQSIYESDWSFD